MKKRLSILSITFSCLLASTSLVEAMSFSVNKNYQGYNLIYASGHIRYGDYSKLSRIYRSLPHNKQTIVVFNSSGGELDEGLKIGRFLKRNRIGSAVRDNGICVSSCAMAFLGGRSKSGSRLMILPNNSSLGYHSFYYKNGNFVRLTKVQKDVSKILNYASYVNAPNYLMAKMFDTKSNSMYFITSQDRYALRIKSGLSAINFTNSNYLVSPHRVTNSSRYYVYKDSAKNYIIRYLKKFNNLVASNNQNIFYSSNTALNSSGYKNWISKNLKYIHLKNIRERSSNSVEAKVIYSLKNGLRVCSINRYKLQKKYSGGWKILTKQHISCNYKDNKLLKKIAKALP